VSWEFVYFDKYYSTVHKNQYTVKSTTLLNNMSRGIGDPRLVVLPGSWIMYILCEQMTVPVTNYHQTHPIQTRLHVTYYMLDSTSVNCSLILNLCLQELIYPGSCSKIEVNTYILIQSLDWNRRLRELKHEQWKRNWKLHLCTLWNLMHVMSTSCQLKDKKWATFTCTFVQLPVMVVNYKLFRVYRNLELVFA